MQLLEKATVAKQLGVGVQAVERLYRDDDDLGGALVWKRRRHQGRLRWVPLLPAGALRRWKAGRRKVQGPKRTRWVRA